MEEKSEQSHTVTRPPVVVIMGHVDHGKSTLLDYIRKTNIVECETGGITQCISAYEVVHKDENKKDRTVTFLDTPGHEAFSQMRSRGAKAADIAILIVSAEDSVKPQTIEAWKTIMESKTPYIVAINKIDKPNANIEKTKMDLSANGIYLEGMGGDVPFVLISAKTGEGVKELLDTIILVADMNEFTGNNNLPASGVIIEAHRESKRGISATCLILNGTLNSGMFVVSGKAIVTTRIMENFLGKTIKKATFSSPIVLVGFDEVPEVGSIFKSFNSKKEAELYKKENSELQKNNQDEPARPHKNSGAGGNSDIKLIPLIIKTDVVGTIEAIQNEISKLNTEEIAFKIIGAGVGAINESDLKMASVNKDSIIVGFDVKMDPLARDLNESLKVTIGEFNIIYKLSDWLKEIVNKRKPKHEIIEVTGALKVLKKFNTNKNKQVIGGKVIQGEIVDGNSIRIVRGEEELGRGKIVGIQQNKDAVKKVNEGIECGIMVESNVEIQTGDNLEVFNLIIK